MALRKIPKTDEEVAKNEEFSTIFDSVKDMKELSEIGEKIASEIANIAKTASRQKVKDPTLTNENIAVEYLKEYLPTVQSDEEREKLSKLLEDLTITLKKNSSLFNVNSIMNNKMVKKFTNSSIGDYIGRGVSSYVNSLPSAYTTLIDVFKKKKDKSDDVRDSIHERMTSQEDITTNSKVQSSLENIESLEKVSQVENNKNFEEIISKIQKNDEYKDFSFTHVIDGINEEISSFMEVATQEQKEVILDTLKDTERFERLVSEAISSIRIDERGNVITTNSITEPSNIINGNPLTNILTDKLSVLSENTKPQISSFAEKEDEEEYRRDSLREQRELNETVGDIHKFLTGKKEEKDDSLLDDLGDMVLGAVGFGKVGKLLGGVGKTAAKAGSSALKIVGKGVTNVLPNKVLGDKLSKLTANKAPALMTDVATNVADNVVGKTIGKEALEGAGKTAGKTAAKAGGKGLFKSLLKKIPGVGLLAGGAFAVDRLLNGDFTGALGELSSGAASLIPGLGTAVSTAIDAGLVVKDIADVSSNTENIVSESNNTNFEQISNLPTTEGNRNAEILKTYLPKEEFNNFVESQNERYTKETINNRLIQGYGYVDGDMSKYGNHIKFDEQSNTYTGFKSKAEEIAFNQDKDVEFKATNINSGMDVRFDSNKEAVANFIRDRKLIESKVLNSDGSVKSIEQLWNDNGYEDAFKKIESTKEVDKDYMREQHYMSNLLDDKSRINVLNNSKISELEKYKILKNMDLNNRFESLKKDSKDVSNIRNVDTTNITSMATKDNFSTIDKSKERSTEVITDTSKRDKEYTHSSTKVPTTQKDSKTSNETNVQNNPTVINNYNTTNNNITNQTKQTPTIQHIVNPMNSASWMGGMR